MFFILFSAVMAAVAAALLRTLRRQREEDGSLAGKTDKAFRVLTVIWLALCFVELFLPDAFTLRYIWDFAYLEANNDAIHALVRAFNSMAILILPVAVFFRRPSFEKLAVWLMLPVVLINIASYPVYLGYYTSELTVYASVFGEKLRPFLTNAIFRSCFFGAVMGLELSIVLYVLLFRARSLRFRSREEWKSFLLLILPLFISNMPINTMQQLTGDVTDIYFSFGTATHFAFIVWLVLEGIVLTTIFRKRPWEDKYILLLIMSLSLLFQYNSFFRTDGVITATRYPLQLCNIAGAFLLVTLLTKSEKMFHFTVTVNVTGALIAIILCDSTTDVGVLYCMNIHYMVEHANVLLVPILALLLGVFKPLKAADLKDFVKGFVLYFTGVWLLGTLFNGLAEWAGNDYFSCNYLFMFKKEAAVRLVGDFIAPFFDLKLTLFGHFHIYLAQPLVLLVFLLICSGIFHLLRLFVREKAASTVSSRNGHTV